MFRESCRLSGSSRKGKGEEAAGWPHIQIALSDFPGIVGRAAWKSSLLRGLPALFEGLLQLSPVGMDGFSGDLLESGCGGKGDCLASASHVLS